MILRGHSHYDTAAQEDRSAPRTRLSIPAFLRQSGGKRFNTVVNDLSLSGFSATAITRMHEGAVCWLTLPPRAAAGPGRLVGSQHGRLRVRNAAEPDRA